jgi:hypothetical protein
MSALDLDPRLAFGGFITGPSNRLAAAAAKRVADAPGAAYNPLFLYGASGLGKTHLLMAIGNEARRANPRLALVYGSIEPLADRLADPDTGMEERERLQNARLLLLDDVQFLVARKDVQEELLAIWDNVAVRGGQIVLAADRPPTEIAGLDRRLLSRFSGGLIADIAPPTHDMRVAIVRRLASEGGHNLATGMSEILARISFGNVRELHGALNRVLAVQEVEQRLVTAPEAATLLGVETKKNQEFTAFVSDIEGAVDELVTRRSPEQRLAEAILRWEGEGFRVARLEAALARGVSAQQAEELVRTFEKDAARLNGTNATIRRIDPAAPELARVDILLDPDRAHDAEVLLARVQERLGLPITQPTPARQERDGAGTAASTDAQAQRSAPPARRPPPGDVKDEWFLSREKVLWDWPYIEDWLCMESG